MAEVLERAQVSATWNFHNSIAENRAARRTTRCSRLAWFRPLT